VTRISIVLETAAAIHSAQPRQLAALGLLLQAAAGCAFEAGTPAAEENRREFPLEPAVGSAEPGTLAGGAFHALALSPPHLYTVDGDVLVRVSTEDGTLEPISGPLAAVPYQLVTDGAYLYGALFVRPFKSEFWRTPLLGGGFDAPSGGLLLGSGRTSAALGVNASQLVSLEARPSPSTLTRSITRFDKDGAGAQSLGTFSSVVTDAFALDDVNAYFTRGAVDLDHAEILSIAVAGGESEVLLSAPSDTFRSLAAAADEVAFASNARVGRVPASGGADVMSSSEGAYLVLADAEFSYYFTSDPGCQSGSELHRVLGSGGVPVAIAHESVPGCIRDAVADDSAVYWLTSDGAQLRKANKQ
jgi:hypothetical protein